MSGFGSSEVARAILTRSHRKKMCVRVFGYTPLNQGCSRYGFSRIESHRRDAISSTTEFDGTVTGENFHGEPQYREYRDAPDKFTVFSP